VAVGESRDVLVTVANGGSAPVVMLPNMVRLRIEGAGAEYVPYPGPPVDPWAGAREMAPGATTTVEFRDTSDKRGLWRLPPGSHRIIAVDGSRTTADVCESRTDLARPIGKLAGDDGRRSVND
jgi:hypothetical protein